MVYLKGIAFVLCSAAMVSGCAQTGETGEPVAAIRLQAQYLDGSGLGEFEGNARSPMLRRGHSCFKSEDGKLSIGVWEAQAGEIVIPEPYPIDELMYVLSGKFVLVDQQGNREECGEGEALIMPKGWSGTFEVPEHVRKIWVSYK
jgi:hypothetical protein